MNAEDWDADGDGLMYGEECDDLDATSTTSNETFPTSESSDFDGDDIIDEGYSNMTKMVTWLRPIMIFQAMD